MRVTQQSAQCENHGENAVSAAHGAVLSAASSTTILQHTEQETTTVPAARWFEDARAREPRAEVWVPRRVPPRAPPPPCTASSNPLLGKGSRGKAICAPESSPRQQDEPVVSPLSSARRCPAMMSRRVSVTLASFSSIVAAYQPALAGSRGAVHMQQLSHLPRRAFASARGPRMAAEEATVVTPEVLAPPKMPTNDDSETLLKIRHTSAHVMAMAVQKLCV